MNHHARLAASITAGLALATALAGCSSNSSDAASSAPAASATASMVGGMTTCDETTISTAIEESLTAAGEGGTLDSLDELQCGDGWAAAVATIGDGSGEAITETLVFQAEGQFWVPKDRSSVCGTPGSDITVRPDDAQVPESVWTLACTTN